MPYRLLNAEENHCSLTVFLCKTDQVVDVLCSACKTRCLGRNPEHSVRRSDWRHCLRASHLWCSHVVPDFISGTKSVCDWVTQPVLFSLVDCSFSTFLDTLCLFVQKAYVLPLEATSACWQTASLRSQWDWCACCCSNSSGSSLVACTCVSLSMSEGLNLPWGICTHSLVPSYSFSCEMMLPGSWLSSWSCCGYAVGSILLWFCLHWMSCVS